VAEVDGSIRLPLASGRWRRTGICGWFRVVFGYELVVTEQFYFTFFIFWLKKYKAEWFHEEEYFLEISNHPAGRITSDLSA
jgi:hypothetical protein